MKFLILILTIFLFSCNPNHPHYKRKSINGWKRKHIIIFKQDSYRNPVIKKEARRKLINPPTINLNRY